MRRIEAIATAKKQKNAEHLRDSLEGKQGQPMIFLVSAMYAPF